MGSPPLKKNYLRKKNPEELLSGLILTLLRSQLRT